MSLIKQISVRNQADPSTSTVYDIGASATNIAYDANTNIKSKIDDKEDQSIELTQAEYEVLTPAEKNNGKTYYITDVGGPGGLIIGSEVVMTGYTKPSSTSAIATTDTVNQAIGKLEKGIESADIPIATTSTAGKVKPDGTTITIDSNGTISGSSAPTMSKTRYTITASSWSNSADANGYYTYSITLNPTLSTSYAPNVYISGANDNTFSTDTEKEQFALLDECNLTASNTLVLYAKTKPESTFYVFIEGQVA